MWQILFHVTPTTVALTLAALVALALLAARAYVRDRESTARFCRRLLIGATGVYLLVLAAPVLSWDQTGESSRHVNRDPLVWVDEWRDANEPEDSFGMELRDGTSAHYSVEPLTQAERKEVLPYGGPYEYFLHEDEQGHLEITDADGTPVDDAHAQPVHQEMGPAVADFLEHRGAESAALIVEEKVVNALLFVPIGIVAFYGVRNVFGRVVFGPALSLTLETVQWGMGAGRSADMADLLVNTLGSLTGTALAGTCVLLVARVSRPPASEDRTVPAD